MTYLPWKGPEYSCGHKAEQDQALWDKAEVAHAFGGHHPVQCTRIGPLSHTYSLAVAQLAVETPEGNQEDHVADDPENTGGGKTWYHDIPPVQITHLQSSQDQERDFNNKQRQETETPPQTSSPQKRGPALGHREAAEVHVQEGLTHKAAEEAHQHVGVRRNDDRLEEEERRDHGEADEVWKGQERLHAQVHEQSGNRQSQGYEAHRGMGHLGCAGHSKTCKLQSLSRGQKCWPLSGAAADSFHQRPQCSYGRAGDQHVNADLLLQVIYSRVGEKSQQAQQETQPQVEESETESIHTEVVVEDTGDTQDKKGEDEDDQKDGFCCALPARIQAQAHGHEQVKSGQIAQVANGRPHTHPGPKLLQSAHGCIKRMAEAVAEKPAHRWSSTHSLLMKFSDTLLTACFRFKVHPYALL